MPAGQRLLCLPIHAERCCGMRQVGLIYQAGWSVGDRICEYPVVLETRDVADRVPAVVAQPVVHTIAKPGAIVNHLQGGLPEIETLRRGADALRIDMAIQEEGDDTCMEDGEDESGGHNKEYCSHQQSFAVAYRKNCNKECRCGNSYPGSM